MSFGHERLDVYRIAMLTKMGGRSYSVKESEIVYYSGNDDTDTDGDPDTDKKQDK